MKFWRNWHKWLGLLLGIQLLFWISGGVVMTSIPIDMVRGAHLLDKHQLDKEFVPEQLNLPVSQYLSLRWVPHPQGVAVEATKLDGERTWLDPATASPLNQLTERQAAEYAASQYLGKGQARQVSLLNSMPGEVRNLSAPVYRVDFDDWIHTSFYLHPVSGQILSVRSDLWRLFDFFWMLHILDFEAREDFNNPLLISLAFVAWLFTLSGFVMLYHSLVKPKWRKWQYQRAAKS
ncbi:PepSY domain-containing protein [Bowmanella dokdonensis]|uniref:PepSY-associated TM helix n=1 Tax=Bowmanella dokdonensis TaxID=751969 RepID=A0A939DLS0_9ALTE|nr:PepSY domain-containing protein [Bowmanella dokdonensis]MBN7824126.1 hypothetical protein [Bowmanella dokdonensis]